LTSIYSIFDNTTNAGTDPQQDGPLPEDGKQDTENFNTTVEQPQQHVDGLLVARLKQLESELGEKDRRIEKLQQECEALKTQLDEKSATEADVRKIWKKTAKELNKLRANSQGFYQVTDEYLVEQINYLKIAIRDFSIQYFDGKSMPKETMDIECPDYWDHFKHTASGRDFSQYLKSPRNCHKLVQAFFWRVIIKELFFRFEWLGKDHCKAFYKVWDALLPRKYAYDYR
jgi:uncharacterized small protein (DUF1192 family)